MWFIAGLLGAALGYFVGWFFNFWEFVNWILAFIGFFIGKAIQQNLEQKQFLEEIRKGPECPNCKVRGGIEIKERKTLTRENFVNHRETRYEEGGRLYSSKEFWYVGEEQVFFKCNKCGYEYSEIEPYKRKIF